MPRRSALLLHDQGSAMAREEPPTSAPDHGEMSEGATRLPWLLPWLLALTGILITLALMR